MKQRDTIYISESAPARCLFNLVEGLQEPMIFLTGDLRVLYANAASRLRFSRVTLSTNDSFLAFLTMAYPEASGESVVGGLEEMLNSQSAEAVDFIMRSGPGEVVFRASLVNDRARADICDPVLAIVLRERDPRAALPSIDTVLDWSSDGVFIVNRENHIVYFNPACEKLTGWMRGRAVMDTFECSNVLRCHNEMGESMGSETLCPAKVFFRSDSVPIPREMLITTKSGKEKWIETNYSPIKNSDGNVEFIVGIMRDIDERKRLESQIVQNRNLAMLGQLVSGIAHEIKNPLGIMLSSVEVLEDEARPVEQRREAASYLRDEIRRLDERVKDFLVFARPRTMVPEAVNINELIQRVVRGYAPHRQPALRVRMNLNEDVRPVQADPDLLHQVFLNLIINADQAMRRGGDLLVETEFADDFATVRLIDEGQGIEEDALGKIFDPFYTTKKDGTGLGLCIVHQILTDHRGRISVKNNVGKSGVTFEIQLPIQPELSLPEAQQ